MTYFSTDLVSTDLAIEAGAILGYTIPDLLDMGCEQTNNLQALNHWSRRQWQPLSNGLFRRRVEELALGFLGDLVLGDRLALLMESDYTFALVDMASLLAGLVNVPLDLTQTIENIVYCLNHSEAKALVIGNLSLLDQLLPYLSRVPLLRWVIVAETGADWERQRERLFAVTANGDGLSTGACLQIPQLLDGDRPGGETWAAHRLSHCIGLLSLAELQAQGKQRWSLEAIARGREQLTPQTLATIIYIASESRQPKGVMLSHENITSNALSAFGSYTTLKKGAAEVCLLFLPLTHIFARVFLYGHLAYGHSIYFSSPNRLMRHLQMVNPTILITVPLLLEKLYERLMTQGNAPATVVGYFQAIALRSALGIAQRYDVATPPRGLAHLCLQLSQKWVFTQWQRIFGTRLHSLICGGAALRPELVNFFNGSGIPVLQGYGLTETSGVICYNRPNNQRAASVGVAMPLTAIKIADDHEILVKAPFVMQGYYRDPAGTAAAIDPEGWLHTGDYGRLSPDGFLHITGVKKAQFKLATGKYVSLPPLENALTASDLVTWAIAVGMNRKFCGMLIFPNHKALLQLLEAQDINYNLKDPRVLALYQNLINLANCHLPYWSTVRKFALIEEDFPEVFIDTNGKIDRDLLYIWYASEIDALYSKSNQTEDNNLEIESDLFTPEACPIFAQSLLHA